MAPKPTRSVPADLDHHIDELYQRPLTEFTAARNALAKTLPATEAARVKQLTKPGIVPWAINQVYWRARSVYDRLLAAGQALRAAEIAVIEKSAGAKAKSAVAAAADAHRKATADAVHQALRLSGQADVRPPVDGLTRMLEAIALAPPDAHPHGRFIDVIQPAGFEALLGITPGAPAAPPAAASAAKRTGARPSADAIPTRTDDGPARQKAVASASRTLQQAQEAERLARAQHDEAVRRLAESERTVARLRQASEAARAGLDQAVRAREAADTALAAVSAPSGRR